jgi:uncharacterized protein (DUF779 family)
LTLSSSGCCCDGSRPLVPDPLTGIYSTHFI